MWIRKSKSLFLKQDKIFTYRFTISVIIAEPPEHVVSHVYKMLTLSSFITLFIKLFAPNNTVFSRVIPAPTYFAHPNF
jgi:hypothetical protein